MLCFLVEICLLQLRGVWALYPSVVRDGVGGGGTVPWPWPCPPRLTSELSPHTAHAPSNPGSEQNTSNQLPLQTFTLYFAVFNTSRASRVIEQQSNLIPARASLGVTLSSPSCSEPESANAASSAETNPASEHQQDLYLLFLFSPLFLVIFIFVFIPFNCFPSSCHTAGIKMEFSLFLSLFLFLNSFPMGLHSKQGGEEIR